MLKQREFLLVPIRIGLSFSPAVLTKKAAVILCFALPRQRFSFSDRDLVCKDFQKQPVSFCFQISRGAYPRVISFTRFCQLSAVSSLTSPSSPAMFICAILCRFFHFANHPLVPLKPCSPSLSAINRASSIKRDPLPGMFDSRTLTYHSHNRWLILPNFSVLTLFVVAGPSLDVHAVRILSLFFRILMI